MAISYKNGSFAYAANGAAPTTIASGTVPAAAEMAATRPVLVAVRL